MGLPEPQKVCKVMTFMGHYYGFRATSLHTFWGLGRAQGQGLRVGRVMRCPKAPLYFLAPHLRGYLMVGP